MLERSSANHDIVLVDGSQALFDSPGGLEQCSTAQLAKQLGAGVILVVESSNSMASTLALAKGHMELDKELHVAAVVYNKVDMAISPVSMQAAMRAAGMSACMLGCIPKVRGAAIECRQHTAALCCYESLHV